MGCFSDTVEKKLSEICNTLDDQEFTNVLSSYDNWTYHIRLSMLGKADYDEYTEAKSLYTISGKSIELATMHNIIESKGITIAETGVIMNPSIESMSMQTFCGHNVDSITTNIRLKLLDTCGMGLNTKINTLASLLGYTDSLMCMPYFITVWFVGYKNDKEVSNTIKQGMPDNCININNIATFNTGRFKLYYEAVVTDAKADCNNSTVAWDMNFAVVSNPEIAGKDIISLSDIPSVNIKKSTDNYVRDVCDAIASSINLKQKQSYGENFTKVFGNKCPLVLHLYTSDNELIFSTARTMDNTSIDNQPAEYDAKDKDEISLLAALGIKNTKISNNKNSTKIPIIFTSSPTSEFRFSPQKDVTLLNLVDTLVKENSNISETSTTRSNFYFEPIGKLKGRQVYVVHCFFFIGEEPGLDYLVNQVGEFDAFKGLDDQLDKRIKIMEKMFIRKYEWNTGVNKNPVLSFSTNFNSIWYLNSGLSSINNAQNNSITTKNQVRVSNSITNDEKAKNKKPPKPPSTEGYAGKSLNDCWDKIVSNNIVKNGVMFNLAISDQQTGEYTPSSTSLAIENNNTSNLNAITIKEAENTNIDKIKVKIGYQNLIESANATELKLKIMGDPVWLYIGSIRHPVHVNDYYNMAIMFKWNSTYCLDNKDNWKVDKLTSAQLPYMITEINSTFVNGNFTQDLKGYAPVEFLASPQQIEELNKN